MNYIDYIKKNHLSLLIILWLVASGVFGWGASVTYITQNGDGTPNSSILGKANRETSTITNPFDFKQGVTLSNNEDGSSNALTVTGTSTMAKSKDGFVAGGILTDSGTTTPVQTIYTALSNMACDANTIGLHVIDQAVFIGAQRISVGTTTASGAPTNSLVATSTIATTTVAGLVIQSYAGDTDGASFVMKTGEIIQISLKDGTTDGEPIASSTNYASREIEFGIWCWTLSI